MKQKSNKGNCDICGGEVTKDDDFSSQSNNITNKKGDFTMEDRKTILLKACLDLLEKQHRTPYALDLLTETVHYDEADCDGYCLMRDIKTELTDDN